MYKTASKFQLHGATLAAMRRRKKPYISPLAAQYARKLNALAHQMFGRPCKTLRKDQRQKLAEAIRQLDLIPGRRKPPGNPSQPSQIQTLHKPIKPFESRATAPVPIAKGP